ncbi:hypothetical protein ACFO0N_17590 [Halobium salinum]|uniref:DUF8107 domain-containing protein n=1 Tax=Halobium salinum TaxID=1364940 RepID=A0ABD5PG45_9EURY|nr:hypothetical protein [Halobium salinum]
MSSFEDGASRSAGDPRVLFVINAVLSTVFAGTVVWGLDFLGILPFTWPTVLSFAAVLVAITYLVTR